MLKGHILNKVACVMLVLWNCAAHAASIHLGLCEGQLSEEGVSRTGSGVISVAVVLPKSLLEPYAGARLDAIRVGLCTTDGISNVNCWVRSELEADNLDVSGLESPVTGWNEVALTGGLTLSADADLVIGYSFEQQHSVQCISIAGPSDENGYWVARNGAWNNRSGSVNGSVSVELVVSGDNVSTTNLSIISWRGDEVTRYGDTFHARCIVKNTALGAIEGYTMSYMVDNLSMPEISRDVVLKAYECDTIDVELASDAVPMGLFIPVVAIVSADGDTQTGDNTASCFLSTYDQTVERKLLLEEFSTENCPNCPRGIETIATCMDEGYNGLGPFGQRTVQITHHVGYTYDWLTVEEDKEYEWFYNKEAYGVYAPACMLDRTNEAGYHALYSGGDNDDVPVTGIAYPNTFIYAIDHALSIPAFVTVSPTVSYDADSRQCTVRVEVDKLPTLDVLSKQPRITIYVIEDSILHHSQAGYSSSTFRHRHVYRKCVTDLWGDPLTFDGNHATASYTVTLPEKWHDTDTDDEKCRPEYVELVVLVNNYNADDRNDCRVLNSASAPLIAHSGTAITAIDASRVQRVEYFSLSGSRLDASSKGLCIKRTTYADGSVCNVKVMK